jgi:hypothetical protein
MGWVGPNASRAAQLADNVAAVHSRQLVGAAVPAARPRPGEAASGARAEPSTP